MAQTVYNKKMFNYILESMGDAEFVTGELRRTDGIVKSVDEFMTLLIDANDKYNDVFQVAKDDKLIFTEHIPREVLTKLNNETSSTLVAENTLRDVRVVTYLANERPGIPSSHSLNGGGIQNIKYRYGEIYQDPDYTGFHIVRFKKEIDAEIRFRVWGLYYQDIRARATLLKKIIETYGWYFGLKGVKHLIWNTSTEEEKWDHNQIVKYKTVSYKLTFTEIKEVREKDIEQIVAQYGITSFT